MKSTKHRIQNTVQEKRPAEIDRRDSRESIASRDRCKQSNNGCRVISKNITLMNLNELELDEEVN